MFELLKKTRVFSETHVRERLKASHAIIRQDLPIPIVRKRNERRSDIIITYVDGEAKSGATYAALYAEENNIVAKAVFSPGSFRKNFERYLASDGQVSAVIIMDDIAATGRSLSENVSDFVSENRDLLESVKIRVISLVATATAQAEILGRLSKIEGVDIDFRTCEVLPESAFAFPDDRSGWASEDEWERARALCVQLGSRIYKQHPLGYGGLGLLVVFPTTVPNNSLPILHSYARAGAAMPWSPLFVRMVH